MTNHEAELAKSNASTPPPLLTATEVAEALRVAVPTMYLLVRTGKLARQIYLGGSSKMPRWRRSDIEAFIKAQSTSPSA